MHIQVDLRYLVYVKKQTVIETGAAQNHTKNPSKIEGLLRHPTKWLATIQCRCCSGISKESTFSSKVIKASSKSSTKSVLTSTNLNLAFFDATQNVIAAIF